MNKRNQHEIEIGGGFIFLLPNVKVVRDGRTEILESRKARFWCDVERQK